MSNLIDLFKASASRQLMSVDDFDLTLAAIDFKAVDEVLANFTDNMKDAKGYNVEDGTATIKVRGMLVPNIAYDLSDWGITGYNFIVDYIQAANDDTAVADIILDVDSGGGYVKNLQSAIDAVANSEKPVRTVATGTMASAAYWLGSAADTVASTSGQNAIGSIGVMIEHTDASESYKARGLERQVFKSGFWKGAFNNATALTKRERNKLQAKVDNEAQVFFDHVATNRPDLTAADVKDFEGETFTATKALKNGLIDSIEDLIDSETGEKGLANMNDTTKKPVEAPVAITQADLDAAVAKATADAIATAKADIDAATLKATARTKLIFDHANSNEAVRAVLTSDAYASVADEDLTTLLDALPSADVSSALDAQAGAGVQPNIAPLDTPNDADKAKAEVVKANEAMADIGKTFL